VQILLLKQWVGEHSGSGGVLGEMLLRRERRFCGRGSSTPAQQMGKRYG
jgi:hypothetical protein